MGHPYHPPPSSSSAPVVVTALWQIASSQTVESETPEETLLFAGRQMCVLGPQRPIGILYVEQTRRCVSRRHHRRPPAPPSFLSSRSRARFN